jgi:hypothetical protein
MVKCRIGQIQKVTQPKKRKKKKKTKTKKRKMMRSKMMTRIKSH